MTFRVFTLVCLFIIRCRFPANRSVANIIRERYGNAALKDVRKLEKLDLKKRKAKLDITFLETCQEANVIPTFLQFRMANSSLRKSTTYDNCQTLLLNEEIQTKQKLLLDLETRFKKSKNNLHEILSYFDFLHIISLFLERNTLELEKIELRQNAKLVRLIAENVRHDPKQIIHNFSSHQLTSHQESVLMKGLNFALPPKKLRYEDFMLPFELLYRDIDEGNKKEELIFAKNELKHIAFSSFKTYNIKSRKLENITQLEHQAFLELLDIDSIIIQKADKGNVIVIIDKIKYFSKMDEILNDGTKFEKMTFCQNMYKNEELDYILEKEEEISKFLKELLDCNVISNEVYKRLKPSGSQPGVLYGLCKVHKGVSADGSAPPFRPILSAINTPSYKIAKFLVPLLSGLTKNKYVSKDSFEFAKNVRDQNSDFLWHLLISIHFLPMFHWTKLLTSQSINCLVKRKNMKVFPKSNLENCCH